MVQEINEKLKEIDLGSSLRQEVWFHEAERLISCYRIKYYTQF